MNKIKFEIKKDNIEVAYKDRMYIKPGCTLDNMNSDPEIIESFDTKEDAIEALKKYTTDISTFSSANGTVFDVTEYYVEGNEYDEEGNIIACNGVWEESKMEITLVDEGGNTIGTFDNYADAEEAYNNYDEECEIRLW